MEEKNRWDAMKLYKLVKKNCNGSTVVVVDDVIGNLIEGIFNFVLIRGDDYDALPQYLKAYEHKYEVLCKAGYGLGNDKLRDLHMGELTSRGKEDSKVYKALKG